MGCREGGKGKARNCSQITHNKTKEKAQRGKEEKKQQQLLAYLNLWGVQGQPD